MSRKSRDRARKKRAAQTQEQKTRGQMLPTPPERDPEEVPPLQMTAEEVDAEHRRGQLMGAIGLLFVLGLFAVVGITADQGPADARPDQNARTVQGEQRTTFGIEAGGARLVRIGGINGRPSPDGGSVNEYEPLTPPQPGIAGFDTPEYDAEEGVIAVSSAGGAELRPVNLATGEVGDPVVLEGPSKVTGLTLGVAPPGAPESEERVGAVLTGDTEIVLVNPETGAAVGDPIEVTGLEDGETIRAIDAGPDGVILALAVGGDGQAGAGWIYRVDAATGQATRLGSSGQPFADDLDTAARYGFDIGSQGTARVIGSDGRNVLVDLKTGSGVDKSGLGPGDPEVVEVMSVHEPGAAQLPARYEAFDSGKELTGSIVELLRYLAVIPLGWFLWGAVRRRRPVSAWLRGLGVVGPMLIPVSGLVGLYALNQVVTAFLASPDQTWPVAEQLTTGSGLLRSSTLFEALSPLLFGIWLAWLSYEMMQAGLIYRFLGALGIGAGVLATVYPLAGAALSLAWIGSVAIIAMGYWPGGRPPAWDAGRAMSPDARR